MQTQQPVWKFVCNLGDVNPLDYGGYFIYEDETGVYGYEGELVELDSPDDEDSTFTIRRILLERCTHQNGIVSDNRFHPDYPAWFAKSLQSVADSAGWELPALIAALCGESARERAQAYRAIFDHYGADNFDSYPLKLSRAECLARYTRGELSRR